MANFELKNHRVTELPAQLEAYSIYYVAPAGTTDYVEIYVSDSTGATARRVINEADVRTLISEEVSGLNEVHVYDSITERDAAGVTTSQFAYVVDASEDSTVDAGGASYVYNVSTSEWVKTSESESMDFVFNWEKIVGKPTSTAAAIDEAVTNSHTHSNKTSLDKIGEDAEGNFTYDGEVVSGGATQWTTTNW